MILSNTKDHRFIFILLSITAILSFFYVDKILAWYFHSIERDNIVILIMSEITEFGKGIYGAGATIILWLYAYIYNDKKRLLESQYLAYVLVTGGIIVAFIKVLFGRARPELLFSRSEFGIYFLKTKSAYWSFPSGHTLTSISLMLSLSMLYPRYRYIFISCFGLISLSRIVLCKHYLSDVIIGGVLGAFISLILFQSWYLKRKSYD
ncbi:MAG: phosphatase PAP2 family protein [Candidatus Comchoanobacterales bacterium]